MAAKRNVAVIVGSLRKGSFNRMMANALAGLAPDLACEILEIRQLSLYDQDLDEKPPQEWIAFREKIRASDAVLFVTPEYNRSVPGVLKNAIDIASRPYGQNSFAGKPAAVMSVSIGAIAGFGANHHLRQSLVFLDMPTLQQPEAYIGNAGQLFDEQGAFAKDDTREFARKFMEAFAAWIDKNAPRR
jgi:chromate reductase